MYILKPQAHETIWGGSKLLPYVSNRALQRIGHLYSLFDFYNGSSTVDNGEYRGISFHTVYEQIKNQYGLAEFEFFPLVLAIVEAREHLSIQVHPDDSAASKLEGVKWGKNESWYFIDQPHEGFIYNGCTCSCVEEVKARIEAGAGARIADKLSVNKGDYVFVPAGTLHAITAGSFVYEIEENSEFTYRFYDYDRVDSNGHKRELHLAEALASIHPEQKSIVSNYSKGDIRERLYTTGLRKVLQGYRNASATLECITVLDETADEIIDGSRVRFGTTIVLEPGEILESNIKLAMMARVNVEV